MSAKQRSGNRPTPYVFRPTPGAMEVLNEWVVQGRDYAPLVNAVITRYGKKCAAELEENWKEFGLLPKRNLAARRLREMSPRSNIGTHPALRFTAIMGGNLLESRGVGCRTVTLKDAIKACVTAKKAANLRPRYIRSLEQYLTLFARGREGTPLAAFDEGSIEEWFAGRSEKPTTRASNVGRLQSMFNYAYRRRWIEENPCERVERIRIIRVAPQILTVQQAETLLRATQQDRPRCLAWLVLCLLAGLRPEEPMVCKDKPQGVTWADVNLDTGAVRVDAATTKVSNRRIVQLEPCAVQWLIEAKRLDATLPLSLMGKRRFIRRMRQVLGFKAWPQDILRHTAASYMVGATSDLPKVACNLGNSPGILARHYRELVTREQAEAFWQILPRSPQLELNL